MPVRGRPAVFLDRDGTLIEERDYLCRPEDVVLLPGAAEAVCRLNRAGIAVVVVTNQSGVARGYFDLAVVGRIHRHLDRQLACSGARIDGYYVCPHHPTEGDTPWRCDCECRKPKPGLLLRAATEMGIDLSRSFMIGDKISDLQAGEKAGCLSLLVRTGYGEWVLTSHPHRAERAFSSLAAAVDFVLQDQGLWRGNGTGRRIDPKED
nr:HAD family hydrolase [Geothermobacter ehrlichii]